MNWTELGTKRGGGMFFKMGLEYSQIVFAESDHITFFDFGASDFITSPMTVQA